MPKFLRVILLTLLFSAAVIATHPATPAKVMWNSRVPPASASR